MEGLEFRAATLRVRGWPWHGPNEPYFAPWLVGVLVRLLIGAALAFVAATSGQVSGPLGGLVLGIAAPLVVERAGQLFGVGGDVGQRDDPDEGEGG